SQVKRNEFEESSIVVEGLRFSLAEWIDRHAKARCPLIGKGITNPLAGGTGTTHQPFLLPTQTSQGSDVLVEAPGVLRVPRMVVGEGAEVRFAKFCANNLKPNRNVYRGAISQ